MTIYKEVNTIREAEEIIKENKERKLRYITEKTSTGYKYIIVCDN